MPSGKESESPVSDSDLSCIRGCFPSLKKVVYLDAARKAPLSSEAAHAMSAYIEQALNCRDTKSLHMQQTKYARDVLAAYLNVDTNKLRFASSTSDAVVLALSSRGDSARGRIGVIEGSHPSVLAVVRQIAGLSEVVEIRVPEKAMESDHFEKQLAGVSVLCAPRISSNGKQYDVSYLASVLAGSGIALILDEAQSAGIYELAETHCPTAHCFTLQKGFLCPPGIGAVCFSKAWDTEQGSICEFGDRNQHVLSALPVSIRILDSISRTKLHAHIRWLSQRFTALVKPPNLLLHKGMHAPHIHLLDLPGRVWQNYFFSQGIIVGEYGGILRVSFGCYTSENDLLLFADRLDRGIRDGLPTH